MDRCKYFLENNLNSVTGWANEKPKALRRVVKTKEDKDERNKGK